MSHAKVVTARFDGKPCFRCTQQIKRGERIIVSTVSGALVGKNTMVRSHKRWIHARCVFPAKGD